MQDKNIISKTLIPHVSHTNLLYIASAVWFFAGGMLLYRGFSGVLIHSEFLLPKVIVALFLGLVFYNLMFKKISKKHITRIEGLKNKKIGSAGLDVYEEESEYFYEDRSDKIIDDDTLARLLSFNNVIVTSHQAFFTREALANIASTTLMNIKDFMEHKKLENEVRL